MLKTALKKIVNYLESKAIPYMIFGGLANSIYGYSRQTYDIDVKIIFDLNKEWPNFYSELNQIGKILPDSPKEFLIDNKVLPVEIDKVRIDYSPGRTPV